MIVASDNVSRAVLTDHALLDDIQDRVLTNPRWYLWWGLTNISLRERIRLASAENAAIEKLITERLANKDRGRRELVIR